MMENRNWIFYFLPSSSCRLSRFFSSWLSIRAGYGFSTVSPMVLFPGELPVFRRGPWIEFECAAKSGAAVIWAIFLHWRRILIKAPIKQIELTEANDQNVDSKMLQISPNKIGWQKLGTTKQSRIQLMWFVVQWIWSNSS